MKMKLLFFFYLITSLPLMSQNKKIEQRIDDLLSKMTLGEKIGQMNQITYLGITEESINQLSKDNIDSLLERVGQGDKIKTLDLDSKRSAIIKIAQQYIKNHIHTPINRSEIGSILNVSDAETVNKLQKTAIEQSRLGIPLIIGRDVIHGFNTIFPIPLGQAASFNPALVQASAQISAKEAREKGVNWTFAPMLDISRDARWGRIAESFGEDPYLTACLGTSMVKGFQGDSFSDPNAIAACAKHFAGYGAAEGGRDYNTTNIPDHLLHNVYLPPFRAAVKAGVATVMTSFNDNDGIPSTGNSYLLKEILRDNLKFDGFIVSDWNSSGEMINHGYAKDKKDVAYLSALAGLDMEMVTGSYLKYLPELVKEGKVSENIIDNAVRNILRIKFKLGLFENPYVDTSKKSSAYSSEHLKVARESAIESAILLKNNNVLPLRESMKIAIIGPMADAPYDQMGTWSFDGDKNHTVTPLRALQTEYKHIKYIYEPALAYSRDKNISDFVKAKQAAAQSDVAIIFLGEESILSGEAHSLSNLNLIGVQSELLKSVKSTGKPVVLVIMAGRPLTIERDLPYADAVLYNFHPGTMGGPAILDLLFGKENPSGKLPVTFVREVGQIPMYYNHNNTGRPAPEEVTTLDKIALEAGQTSLGNTSYYLDSGKDPLFPFGYGLSYTTFEYSDLKLSSKSIPLGGSLKVKATITNTGKYQGTEIVQLYIRDKVGSIVRPVKELKGFERISLSPGESKIVEFTISTDDLAFYGKDKVFKAETGEFDVWIGTNSQSGLKNSFSIN